MFKICAHQFRRAFLSPRIYLALIVGCAVQIIAVFPLLDFSKVMGEPLGIFEAFLYFNTDTYAAACAFLGAVLMVSDIPFSSQNETYTLLRVSRKTWVSGKVLYLLGISAVYYLVLFIAGALFVSENAFAANVWSLPLTVLAKNGAPELAWEYQVNFPYGNLMTLTPAIACILSYLLSVCYAFVMSLVIFWLNLRISNILSYLAAVLVHVAGYILTIGFLTDYFRKFSLLANSLIMYHNVGESQAETAYLTLPQSFLAYAAAAVVLFLLILHTIHSYDFRITVGTKQ